MIKKTVTYTDMNGLERTEDFYFNLTEAELAEMNFGVDGGMKALLEKIIAEKNQQMIIEYFKKIVLMSYGEKSIDGRYFEKSEKLRNSFAPTEAYSKIFMELARDADAAAKFINGIIPANAANNVAAANAEKTVIGLPSAETE